MEEESRGARSPARARSRLTDENAVGSRESSARSRSSPRSTSSHPFPLAGRTAGLLAVLLALLPVSACSRRPIPPRAGITLGGVAVSGEVLERGALVYARWCRTCHGEKGAGDGPTGRKLRPPPRDLRLGKLKFASVAAGELPTDADFARIVRGGLEGTGMLPWAVPDDDLAALIAHVKSLSPAFRNGRAGEPIVPPPDPWLGRRAEGVSRGALVYHALTRCWSCHPSHMTQEEITRRAGAAGFPVPALRADAGTPVETPSAWGPIRTPDLTRDPIRAGRRPEDLYRTIACGIGGTAMPTWKGSIPESDLWALVRYTEALTAAPRR